MLTQPSGDQMLRLLVVASGIMAPPQKAEQATDGFEEPILC
jgi:hypothetical protein